jgi:ribonucleotide monophosphatase NagD (HAD superfamily)
MPMTNHLQNIRCFLLGMDGTFYLGDKLLPGAHEFIDWAKANKKQFIFLTNNSSKSKKAYREKLKKLGFDLPDENFFTSGEATIIYLKKNYPNRPV